MTNVISIVEYRARRTPLQEALVTVKRHQGLRVIDKAAITRLSCYATDQGFFDLDQRERGAVTGLKKFHLMSGLARVKKAGLLHKADPWGLHRIGEHTPTIRYRPAQYMDFCKCWIPEGEPA